MVPFAEDKTFFFMNYDGQRLGESPTYPATLINNLTTINLAKAAMGLAPEDLNTLKTIDHDNGFVRLDHQVNSQQSLDRSLWDCRRAQPEYAGGRHSRRRRHRSSQQRTQYISCAINHWSGSLNTLIKPELVNTALVQWSRRHNNFPAVTGQPNLDIPNTLLFGHNFGTFDATNESRVQVSDSVAWVKGNHYWKFGGDFNYIWDFVIWPGFTPMRIILPGFNCMVDFARFVNQTAQFPRIPPMVPVRHPSSHSSQALMSGPIRMMVCSTACPSSSGVLRWEPDLSCRASLPPVIPPDRRNVAQCLCQSPGLLRPYQPQLPRVLRPGPVAAHAQTDLELRSAMGF